MADIVVTPLVKPSLTVEEARVVTLALSYMLDNGFPVWRGLVESARDEIKSARILAERQ